MTFGQHGGCGRLTGTAVPADPHYPLSGDSLQHIWRGVLLAVHEIRTKVDSRYTFAVSLMHQKK